MRPLDLPKLKYCISRPKYLNADSHLILHLSKYHPAPNNRIFMNCWSSCDKILNLKFSLIFSERGRINMHSTHKFIQNIRVTLSLWAIHMKATTVTYFQNYLPNPSGKVTLKAPFSSITVQVFPGSLFSCSFESFVSDRKVVWRLIRNYVQWQGTGYRMIRSDQDIRNSKKDILFRAFRGFWPEQKLQLRMTL